MRRPLAAVLLALTTGLAVLPAVPSSATDGKGALPGPGARPLVQAEATRTLDKASTLLEDDSTVPDETGKRPDATLALRDLFVALPRLEVEDRRKAEAVLARPTDGGGDLQGDGYSTRSRKKCATNVCLHWVNSTADAPPGRTWVDKNLGVLSKVWRHQVRALGYRAPVKDGGRGGNNKFDVYLKELGSKGLYGYCVPERRKPGSEWLASGYCVLDNDFAARQYGAPPVDSLRVTAAHEFFHAVQFAYDYGEDRWLMEASATWMEERFADSVNDNRQYLPHGQVRLPHTSLDRFAANGFNQYGNWAFFEFLSTRFGKGTIKAIWNKAGAFQGAPDAYSTRAVSLVLEKKGGFAKVFRSYAAANTIPGRTYPEGGSWPSAETSGSWRLGKSDRRLSRTYQISHLASRNVVLRPARSLKGKRWTARISIDGPRRRTSPGAQVIIKKKSGAVVQKGIALSRKGNGSVTLVFTRATVKSVTLTLVNASTRFDCWTGNAAYSCQGTPRDNGMRFGFKAVVRQR